MRPTQPTRSSSPGAPPRRHRRRQATAQPDSYATPTSPADPTLTSLLSSLSPVLAPEERLGRHREPSTRRRSKRRLARDQELSDQSELKRLAGFYSATTLANELRSVHQPRSFPRLDLCQPRLDRVGRSTSEVRCATCRCPFGQLRAQDLHDSDRFHAALAHLVEINKAREQCNLHGRPTPVRRYADD
eukprot:COSAG02_NODE_24038_length_699_cov_2.328333_1_plen_187_part_01